MKLLTVGGVVFGAFSIFHRRCVVVVVFECGEIGSGYLGHVTDDIWTVVVSIVRSLTFQWQLFRLTGIVAFTTQCSCCSGSTAQQLMGCRKKRKHRICYDFMTNAENQKFKRRILLWFYTHDLTSVDCLNAVAVKHLVGIERLQPFCLWNFHDDWSVCVRRNCQGFEFVLTAQFWKERKNWLKMMKFALIFRRC